MVCNVLVKNTTKNTQKWPIKWLPQTVYRFTENYAEFVTEYWVMRDQRNSNNLQKKLYIMWLLELTNVLLKTTYQLLLKIV